MAYFILRARPSEDLEYDHAVLIATFQAKNKNLFKELRKALTQNPTSQELFKELEIYKVDK